MHQSSMYQFKLVLNANSFEGTQTQPNSQARATAGITNNDALHFDRKQNNNDRNGSMFNE